MLNMNAFAFCLVLTCGTIAVHSFSSDLYDHHQPDSHHEKMKQCLEDKKYEIEGEMFQYQMCLRSYISTHFLRGGGNDLETQLKHIFKQICRNPDGITQCIQPIANIIMSCIDNSPDYMQDYLSGINVTFGYLCEDEGHKLAELLADPNEITCLKNLQLVLLQDECEIGDEDALHQTTDPEQNCKNTEQFLNCLSDGLRRRCYTHKLLNYIEKYFHTIMKSGTCKPYYNGILKGTISPQFLATLKPFHPLKKFVVTTERPAESQKVIKSASSVPMSSAMCTVMGLLTVYKFLRLFY